MKGLTTKQFKEYGISFRYHSDLKVENELIAGIRQITLNSHDSTMMLFQIIPHSINSSVSQESLARGFQEEFRQLGVDLLGNKLVSCTRSIGGVMKEGTAFTFSAVGMESRMEIYTFRREAQTVAFILQYAIEDQDKAASVIKMVANSFK